MNRSVDIVIISLARWDSPYSSISFSIAKEFAKTNRVFFIDHPFSVKDFLNPYSPGNSIKVRSNALLFGRKIYRKLIGAPDALTIVTPRLTLPINWLSAGSLYDKLSRFNERIVSAALSKLIADFNIKEYIFINSYDPFFLRKLPKDDKVKLSVYQTVDDISQEPYTARHGIRLEMEAVKQADITLATSRELVRLMSKYSENVYCFPNAADFSLFNIAVQQELSKPKELEGITEKVICYTGNIGTRINYELLKKIALFHSDKILLMVGPLSTKDYKRVGLDKLKNVIFTGAKDISQLPAYLQHSHCAIIPFEYSTLTKSIYPLKINEYLTAGKAVVSTAFSEDIKDFSDVAWIAETEDDFLKMVTEAVNEDPLENQERRISKARSNTWKARVTRFWEIVENYERKNRKEMTIQ